MASSPTHTHYHLKETVANTVTHTVSRCSKCNETPDETINTVGFGNATGLLGAVLSGEVLSVVTDSLGMVTGDPGSSVSCVSDGVRGGKVNSPSVGALGSILCKSRYRWRSTAGRGLI